MNQIQALTVHHGYRLDHPDQDRHRCLGNFASRKTSNCEDCAPNYDRSCYHLLRHRQSNLEFPHGYRLGHPDQDRHRCLGNFASRKTSNCEDCAPNYDRSCYHLLRHRQPNLGFPRDSYSSDDHLNQIQEVIPHHLVDHAARCDRYLHLYPKNFAFPRVWSFLGFAVFQQHRHPGRIHHLERHCLNA